MNKPFTRAFLGVAGAIAMLIGGAVLLVPHAFFATNHITLGTDPNLMSEIRAPGGLLLATGLIMIAGAAMQSLLRAGLLTAAVVFSMYGVSRLVSAVLDGMPSGSLVSALGIELAVGMIAIILIMRFGLLERNG